MLKQVQHDKTIMKRKKELSIVLASPYAFTDEPGGVKDFILGLKKALQRQGCEVFVIAPGSKDAQRKGLIDFVLGMDFKIVTDQTGFRASLSRKATAEKILKEVKPDIIVLHEPFVPSVGHTIISSIVKPARNASHSDASGTKNGKRPVIIGQFHANREDLNWPLKAVEFVFRHLVRRPKLNEKKILGLSLGFTSTINNNLDGRIAVSIATKNFWQKKFPARLQLPSQSDGGQAEYKIIYNGINTDELSPDKTKINNRIEQIILFAGRHDPRKGIGDLIKAIKILVQMGSDNIRVRITGKGEMTGVLQGMVKKLDLQEYVEFTGILSRRELVNSYKTADLVVAPSTGGEGFNRTIIEARSCGTPVVCTDIEGQNEAIGGDLAPFMSRPKNPHSLARQIMEILNLPESQKKKIGKQGREDVISHFDWDIIVKQHLEYYRSLLR